MLVAVVWAAEDDCKGEREGGELVKEVHQHRREETCE